MSTLFQNTLTILCYLHLSTKLLNSGYVNNNLWLQTHTTTILFSLISQILVTLDINCNFSNVCKIWPDFFAIPINKTRHQTTWLSMYWTNFAFPISVVYETLLSIFYNPWRCEVGFELSMLQRFYLSFNFPQVNSFLNITKILYSDFKLFPLPVTCRLMQPLRSPCFRIVTLASQWH